MVLFHLTFQSYLNTPWSQRVRISDFYCILECPFKLVGTTMQCDFHVMVMWFVTFIHPLTALFMRALRHSTQRCISETSILPLVLWLGGVVGVVGLLPTRLSRLRARLTFSFWTLWRKVCGEDGRGREECGEDGRGREECGEEESGRKRSGGE